MSYQLSFGRQASYDPGLPGITIPVTLKLKDISVTLEAKVDTGATDCILARRYAEELGLTIESGQQVSISTATGTFTAWGHDVTMTVLDYEFDVPVFFAADDSFKRSVLGRRGFLDRVRVGIVDYEGKLYLSRYEGE